jgi:hypothetical protein
MMVSWNGLYMASLVKKLFILFLVCHDLRQTVTNHCDSFQPQVEMPARFQQQGHQGPRGEKRDEQGLVV